MKYRWDKKYLHWGVTAFLVIIASISFFLLLFRLDSIGKVLSIIVLTLNPIIYGLCFAYLLIPVMNFFDRHLNRFFLKRSKNPNRQKIHKISKILSIFITIVLTLLVIIAIFNMIIPQLITSIMGIFDSFPLYIRNFQAWISKTLEDNPELAENLSTVFANVSTYLENWVKNDLIPQVNELVKSVTSGVWSAVVALKNIVIGIIVSVYVMASKDLFTAQAKRICYAVLKPKQANHLIATTRKAHRIFGGFISGKLLDSLIIGILCFIVMSIFHWPYAVLISVIVGVTNIIPFFGPFIGAIPSALLILLVDPLTCLYFVIFIIILQQFDGNILGPKILGDSTGLSSFWVIFAILVGGGLFGFIGMIVGVPTFAIIYTLLRDAIQKRLKSKHLPSETKEYRDLESIDEETGAVRLFPEETIPPKVPKPKKENPKK
jgi:predicted PurR-regulated permease PerM